jgi:hypothetical protein
MVAQTALASSGETGLSELMIVASYAYNSLAAITLRPALPVSKGGWGQREGHSRPTAQRADRIIAAFQRVGSNRRSQ